jgi:hypothetical protein
MAGRGAASARRAPAARPPGRCSRWSCSDGDDKSSRVGSCRCCDDSGQRSRVCSTPAERHGQPHASGAVPPAHMSDPPGRSSGEVKPPHQLAKLETTKSSTRPDAQTSVGTEPDPRRAAITPGQTSRATRAALARPRESSSALEARRARIRPTPKLARLSDILRLLVRQLWADASLEGLTEL